MSQATTPTDTPARKDMENAYPWSLSCIKKLHQQTKWRLLRIEHQCYKSDIIESTCQSAKNLTLRLAKKPLQPNTIMAFIRYRLQPPLTSQQLKKSISLASVLPASIHLTAWRPKKLSKRKFLLHIPLPPSLSFILMRKNDSGKLWMTM